MSDHAHQSTDKNTSLTHVNMNDTTALEDEIVSSSHDMKPLLRSHALPPDPGSILAMQSTLGNHSTLQKMSPVQRTGSSSPFRGLKMVIQRLHPLEDPSNIASTSSDEPKPEQDLDTDGKLTPVYAQAWEVAWTEFKPKVEDISKQLPGSTSSVAPLKGRERASEKAKSDYGGNTGGLVDIARASIVCKTAQQVLDAWALVNGAFKVVRVKNRFANPSDGYRDLMINVELSNNHIAELQLHLEAIIKAKEAGHKYYETARTIEAKPETERSEQEKKDLAEAKEAMKQLYDAAWEEAKSIPDK